MFEEMKKVLKKIRNNIKENISKKTILIFVGIMFLFAFLTYLYFSFPLVVMPDSSEYYHYLRIFYGHDPISTWNVVRGPSLPIVLFLGTYVFGNSMSGILATTYVFFVSFLIIFAKVLVDLFRNLRVSEFKRIVIISIFVIFLLFNSVLFGYFHSLLTEFLAIFLALICCLLCWNWVKLSFPEDRLKYIWYSLAIMLLFLFTWFLKQPYFSIIFFPFVISLLISVSKEWNIKNILLRGTTFFACILLLILAIEGWKQFLVNNGVDYESGRNNELFLSSSIVQGISNRSLEKNPMSLSKEEIERDKFLSVEDKEEIKKILDGESQKFDKFELVTLFSHSGQTVGKEIIYYSGNRYSVEEAFTFWKKVAFRYPLVLIDSYFSNYLATINVYTSTTDEKGNIFPIKKYFGLNHENASIGLSYLDIEDNFLWVLDYHYDRVANLYSKNESSVFSRVFMDIFSGVNLVFYSALFILVPFMLIHAICSYLSLRKSGNSSLACYYEFAIILLGFSMLHVVFHSVMGALIDRYAYVAFPEAFLGGIIMFIMQRGEVNSIKSERSKLGNKILLIIPAYNEEKSIVKVCSSIKKSKLKPDFVVINDGSTDGTEKVCKENNYPVVSLVENLGIGGAVQTGYKYALENGYDIAVQFDGDGQHDINYLGKIVNPLQQGEADLCIGSRFVEGISGFKSTWVRRIGIKVISTFMFCVTGVRIKDPTSGFRACNRDIINVFSKEYPAEYPEPESTVSLLRRGFEVKEVGVEMREREHGTSSIDTWKSVYYMINVSLSILVRSLRKEE